MSQASEDALRLREWAWALLAGGPAAPPPDAGEGGWRLFLAVERCAAVLRSRLSAARVELSAGADAALRRRADVELKRLLSARMQLAAIGALARERGWRPVVLKGGLAAVGAGEPVDVADVDVLLPLAEAPLLARALDERGYAIEKGIDEVSADTSYHHMAQRRMPGGIQVEIHFALPNTGDVARQLAAIVPLPQPGLYRLSPPDHLWHVLVHSALDHAFRRGTLRDVLVAAAALGDCSDVETAEVEARVAAHPFHAALGTVLAMARAVRARTPVPDPFPEIAAGNYLLIERLAPRGLPEQLADEVSRLVFARLGGPADRAEYRASLTAFRFGSALGPLARLEKRAPGLARAARVCVRLAMRGAAAPLALPLAAESRRTARAVLGPRG